MVSIRTKGFTAIELVVISVVAVTVMAILLPVVEAVKERDRLNACLSNLKQCSQALKMYTDDYDGDLPASALVANPPSQTQVVDFLTGKGYPYPATPNAKATTWPQMLQDNMKNRDVVVCPCDAPHGSTPQSVRVSYWYKYANDVAWRDSSIKARDIWDYGYESDQIAFYEHSGLHAGDAAGIKNGVLINVAYLDAHVETVTVVDGPADYPPASDERTGASATRLGEPMYYNYKELSPNPGIMHSPADFFDPRYCYDRF